jgi:hypothetical protein
MIQELKNISNENLSTQDLKTMRNLSLLITIIASIDVFFFYINFDSETWLYIGASTHLVMLLFMAKIWNCTTYNRTAFYLFIFLNYFLIIPKYFFNFNVSGSSWDVEVELILRIVIFLMFFVPQYVVFYIFQDIKQITILNINSMMVIGLCQRGELIHNWGFNDLETIGVVTFITFLTLAVALMNYIILLQIRYHKLKKESLTSGL